MLADPCLFCSRSWERWPSRPWRTRPARRSPPTASRTRAPPRATRPAWRTPGTVAGGAPRAAGRFGNALSFDGVNDLVRIPDAGSLNLASGMTLEAWVNPAAAGGARTVLLKERRTGPLLRALRRRDDAPRARDARPRRDGDAAGRVRAARRTPGRTSPRPTTARPCASTSTASRWRLDRVSTGPLIPGNGALTIGGNASGGEWFARPDRRGARLRPRAHGRRDPGRHGDAGRRARGRAGAGARRRRGRRVDRAGQHWPMVAVHASMLSERQGRRPGTRSAPAVDSEQRLESGHRRVRADAVGHQPLLRRPRAAARRAPVRRRRPRARPTSGLREHRCSSTR